MSIADSERDERLARLLEEVHPVGGTLCDADTLRQAHPELAEEVVRLAKVEDALRMAAADCKQIATDETVSSAAPGNGPDTEAAPKLDGAAQEPSHVGRYRIVQRLGEGGMGTVYAADDPQLQRRVAIKVPHFTGSFERQELASRRFLREARSAAAIEHSNVCPIYDVSEHDGRPFVVMALIEGQSLNERLRQKPGFELRDAVALVAKVANGLGAVHAHGIVHRDLKPGNILLRQKDGEPILTDFGLAQVTQDEEHLTADGMIMGTPAYMAPEQADPKLGPATARSDLYSLGVILFEMVAQRRPFEGTMMQIFGQLSSSAAPSVSKFRPDVEPGLAALIARALARNPTDRFPDAAAFAAALTAWLDSHAAPTITMQPSPADTTVVMVAPHRRRWIPVAAAAAVLLTTVGFGVVWWLNNRPENHAAAVAVTPAVVGVAPVPAMPKKLQGAIDVKVWRKAEYDPIAKSLNHPGWQLNHPAALPMAPGDWMRIEVTLNRPAYAYVIWIDTEGQVTPLYPWNNMNWAERPRSESPKETFSLPEGADSIAPLGPGPAGMETLILLARDEPLPPEVDLKSLLGKFPPQKAPDPRAAAWFENGAVVRNEVDRGAIRLDQAQIVENPVLQTQSALRTRLGDLFRYTRAVSFSNQGD